MRPQPLRFRPLEQLEDRSTPAGTVTGSFAHGTWTLTGDAAGNEIIINSGGTPNSFTVTGQTGTTVAGVTTPANVKNIVIRLFGGQDEVDVNTSNTPLAIAGNLSIFGGNEANDVYLDTVQIGGNLSVSNGQNTTGDDDTYFVDSTVNGNVYINNGNGDSDCGMYRDSAGLSYVRGHVTVVNGAGEDGVYLNDTNVGGNVTVQNGLPSSGGYAGYTNIYNNYNATRSLIGGNVNVSYAGGEVDYDGIWDTEILGNVNFKHGSGEYELNIDGYEVTAPVIIHGNLTVQTNGPAEINIGEQYKQTGLIVGKNLNITTGGGGDSLILRQLAVSGSTTINTGSGNDTLEIDDVRFLGSFQLLTGAGADQVTIDTLAVTFAPAQFARSTVINLGAGDDKLVLGTANDPMRAVQFGGPTKLVGGDGDDQLSAFNVTSVFGQPIEKLFEIG